MRFVSCSIKYLVTELENMGIKRSELKASLLGGAQMNASNSDLFRIGERNVSLAKELLMSYHINIEYEDTLGNKSRALNYNSSDGTFLMKKN
jgi:chemotaxis protein CheD